MPDFKPNTQLDNVEPCAPVVNAHLTARRVQNPSATIASERRHDHEMFDKLNENHLFMMVRCLLVTHDFAKRFNGDNEQRTILWKAGKPVALDL